MVQKLAPVLLVITLACGGQKEDSNNTEKQLSQTSGDGKNTFWSAPSGWIAEDPTSQFRKSQYRLSRVNGDPEDATCIVFQFPGGGGGAEANLQRWYGQFIQPDGRSSEEVAIVKRATVNELEHTVLDLSGTYLFKTSPMAPTHTEKPNFRLLAAVVEGGEERWFVKLVGPAKTVARWAPSFSEFLQSFNK